MLLYYAIAIAYDAAHQPIKSASCKGPYCIPEAERALGLLKEGLMCDQSEDDPEVASIEIKIRSEEI